MNKILILLFFCIIFNNAQSQDIKRVINISNDSKILEFLSAEYKNSLFTASDTNFVKTMQNWKHLLTAMELYAKQINFNVNGVHLWLKVFWAKDGTIEYITYYLLDKSVNINQEDFEAFLRSFMRNYELPQTHKTGFSYDSRVVFPLYLMK